MSDFEKTQNHRQAVGAYFSSLLRDEGLTVPQAGKGHPAAMNPITGKPFEGINRLHLDNQGFNDPRWMTAKQASLAGYHVLKGEIGTAVEYWSNTKQQPLLDEAGNRIMDANGSPKMDTVRLSRPEVFYATVFNAEQMDGVEPYEPQKTIDGLKASAALMDNLGFAVHQDKKAKQSHFDFTEGRIVTNNPNEKAKGAAQLDYRSEVINLAMEGTATFMNRDLSSDGHVKEQLRLALAEKMLAEDMGIGRPKMNESRMQTMKGKFAVLIENDPNELFRAARDAQTMKTWLVQPELRRKIEENFAQRLKAEQADKGKEKTMVQVADRHYLNLPKEEKEEAKALGVGVRWDPKAWAWYVHKNDTKALKALAKWDKPLDASVKVDPGKEFGEVLRNAGFEIKGDPIMDGQQHRARVEGKTKTFDGVYRGYVDGTPTGTFMNYVTGENGKWVATGRTMDATERAQISQSYEARRAERDEARRASYAKGAKTAYGIYQNTEWASQKNASYLKEKGVYGHGIKVDNEGKLIIPIRDVNGKLQSLQFVSNEGKSYLSGAQKHGGMHVVRGKEQEIGQNGRIVIAEGYATAASIHEATGEPVVAAFDSSNLTPVATTLRQKFPRAQIVIAADDDYGRDKNVGLEKAYEAARVVGGHVIAPELSQDDRTKGLTDFNDVAQTHGKDAVKQVIETGLEDIMPKRGQSQAQAQESGQGMAMAG